MGIRLQMKAKMRRGTKLDKTANTYFEHRWKKFMKLGQCTVRRTQSGRDLDKHITRLWKVDGEVFVRKVPGFDNANRLAYQILDPMACPIDLVKINQDNGNRIDSGIELDAWNAPVAYWFKAGSSTDWQTYEAVDPTTPGAKYIRIPAAEIDHIYAEEFVNQLRGFPFGQAAIQSIYTLGGYFYTELTAADAASRKMGFYKPPAGFDLYEGRDDEEDPDEGEATNSEKDAGPRQLEIMEEAEPATFSILPDGWGFEGYDPNHPVGNFDPFVKAQKRNIANGLDVAYNIFANDLVGVNFSSIRQGVLDERDAWMDDQQFLIEHWKDGQIAEWLAIQLLLPDSPYLPQDFERLNDPRWNPKRWPWVDPKKDAEAAKLQRDLGAKAPQQIASEQGNDWEENMELFRAAIEQMAPMMALVSSMKQLADGMTPERSAELVDTLRDAVGGDDDEKSNENEE